jgi:hypothetical protein
MQDKEKFAKFAKGEGRKVDDGVVMFGEDEEAAQVFALKARKAGFQALVGLSKDDSSDGLEEWGVNLV